MIFPYKFNLLKEVGIRWKWSNLEDKEALFCFGAIEANKLMIMHMDESLIENMISLRVSVYIARPYLERTTQDWLMHLSFKKN